MQEIHCIGQLEIAVLLAGRWSDDLLCLFLRRLAGEVAGQIGLTQPQKLLRILIVALTHRIVGDDAGCLDRMPGWCVVTRGGEALCTSAVSEWNDSLDRALAERSHSDNLRALVILQRARDDLGCTRRAAVDDHHARLATRDVDRPRIVAVGI